MPIFSAQKREMNRIKDILQEKGIKQTWLAEKLGKSFNMINDYCNNKRQQTLETLSHIATILNVDIIELLVSTKNTTQS